ncbi:MAG: hypothetical protein ACLT8O_07670 [Blautia massiliensis (ex Durand et al. 2017)]
MAMMMGNVLPFGVTRDMKNVFLLIDYWQQATRTDMESFMHLILRQYGGRKFLPKEKPCTMEYGVYLKDPFPWKPVIHRRNSGRRWLLTVSGKPWPCFLRTFLSQ